MFHITHRGRKRTFWIKTKHDGRCRAGHISRTQDEHRESPPYERKRSSKTGEVKERRVMEGANLAEGRVRHADLKSPRGSLPNHETQRMYDDDDGDKYV